MSERTIPLHIATAIFERYRLAQTENAKKALLKNIFEEIEAASELKPDAVKGGDELLAYLKESYDDIIRVVSPYILTEDGDMCPPHAKIYNMLTRISAQGQTVVVSGDQASLKQIIKEAHSAMVQADPGCILFNDDFLLEMKEAWDTDCLPTQDQAGIVEDVEKDSG